MKIYLIYKYSSLAQSVEHSAVNRVVVGSSPTGGAWKARKFNVCGFYLFPRATSQADMLACPFGDCRESQRPSGALTLQHAPRGKIDRLLKKDHLEIQRSAVIPYRNKLNRMKEQ